MKKRLFLTWALTTKRVHSDVGAGFPDSAFASVLRKAICHLSVLALLLMAIPAAIANPPDLTNGETRTDNGDNNLGPTGMRGWMYNEATSLLDAATTKSRQILVTSVDAGSPADGILAANDVILGANGTGSAPTLFTADARKSLGYAIADAEARNPATLQLLRWRAGVTDTVQLTLQYLGAYSATAPYNCPKSAAILEMGLQKMMAGESSGLFSLGALALLAADDPSNPNNAARQTRARNEILAMIPSAGAMAGMNSPYAGGGPTPWAAGHTLIMLCEYYLKTNDPVVLPAIDAYVNQIAKGQSPFGSMGHSYAGSWPDGSPNGPMVGYGAVNSAAIPALLGLQLAKKCGSTQPQLDTAIERASRFFASYVGKGSIPYGEHMPGGSHTANGKSGAAALIFEMQPQRAAARDYFAKMSTAGSSQRENGHTGYGFNALWSPLGAAVGGNEAASSHFLRASWMFDLCRRWDGSFAYDKLSTTSSGYRSNWRGFNMSTAVLLTYALPLRNLQITGKGRNPAGCLSHEDVVKADLADTYDPTIRSTSQLIDDLASFSSIVRSAACSQLAARTGERAQILATLVPMATNLTSPNRTGAIEALGKIADPSTASALVAFLDDEDDNVRYFAAAALRQFPREVLMPMIYDILAVAARNTKPRLPLDKEDPAQFANAQLIYLMFGLLADSIDGIDRNYLYPAIRMAASHPLGAINGNLQKTYSLLTAEDCLALADVLVDSVEYQSPGDTMFSAKIRTAGLDAMESRKFAEAVPLAEIVHGTDGRSSVSKYAIGVLGRYAGATALVEPDPRTIDFLKEFWGSNDSFDGNIWPDALAALNAIAADTNPVPPTPFKGIQSVTADSPTLTLPANWTKLRVKAYDYAKGDSRFTWRKVHGAGEVSFTPNGTAASKNTIALFDGTPGQYLFEVTMSDSRGFTQVHQTVAVTLRDSSGNLPSNNSPSAFAQTVTVGTATPSPISLTGSDPENLALNYQINTPPSHGTLTGTAPYLVYTSDFNYTGPDSFSFQVMDSEGQVASATVSLTVGTAAPTGLAVYEPFDYPAGALGGKSGASEVGFAGPWNAPTGVIVANDSLTYGPLAPKGGKATVSNNNLGIGGSRVISPSALAEMGLLADGATLWMSAVIGNNPSMDGSSLLLVLANSSFSSSGSGWNGMDQWIQNEGAQAGQGVGFMLNGGGKGMISAARVGNASGSLVIKTMANSDMDGNAYRYYGGQYGLIVAKITWGATPQDPDLIEIYQPNRDLRLPEKPITSITAQVDQSTFDTLAWHRSNAPVLDEIRIGADYRSVLIGSVPAPADAAAPVPNPIAFHSAPAPAGPTSIRMVAATAFDPSDVDYYFTCTSGGGHDSGWQSSPEYTDSGLTPGVSYSYTVKARDRSLAHNETASSTAASVTLPVNAQVPVVLGFSQAEAEALITARGLVVGTITTAPSSSVDQGDVAQQNPAGGTSAAVGTSVNLVISDTVLLANVPDLTGQAQSAAETALDAQNLLCGTVFTDYSETIPAGQIIGTNPPAGSQVAPGSTVNLVVSAGPFSALLPLTELLFEDFESPAAPTAYVQGSLPDNGKWIGPTVNYGATLRGITDKAGGDFSAPYSNYQAFALRYKNSGITTAQGVIGTLAANTRYTVSFDVIRDNFNAGTNYQCELVAFNPGDDRTNATNARPGTVLASAFGGAPTDGSINLVSFEFTTLASNPHLGKDISIRFVAPYSDTNALVDNVRLQAVGVPLADTVPPLLVSISPEDEAAGVGIHDVLILTLNEAVAPGTGSFTLRNVTDGTQQFLSAADPSVVTFSGNTVRLHPPGGLLPDKQYTVFASLESVRDQAGNRFAGIGDPTAWNFTTSNTDSTPPSLTIFNNHSSDSVEVGTAVTYLLAFSEAINDTTLDATDLGNAGTSTISIGAITMVSPGFYSVAVTPTTTGTLQLKVVAGAVITDLANHALDTTTAIADAETLNIIPTPISLITYDGNGQTGGLVPVNQEKQPNVAITLATNYGNLVKTGSTFAGWNTAADGSGTAYPAGATYDIDAPLTLYAYWELGTNGTWLPTTAGPFNWNDSANWSGGVVATGFNRTALFTPNITAAQTVNLDGATTIGNITFTDASSSHDLTISGTGVLTLTRTAGTPVIDVTQSGRTLTISGNIAGTSGLQKNGAGNLVLSGTNNTYSGTTIVSAGILQGNKSNTGASPFGTNSILLNGGTLRAYSDGDGTSSAQTITFGNNVTVGGNASIVYSRIASGANNKTIALGNLSMGANTLSISSFNVAFAGLSFTGANLTGDAIISNSNYSSVIFTGAITETGGTRSLTKQGGDTLRLLGTNTYTGTTTISAGTLEVQGSIASSSDVVNNATLAFNSGSTQSYGNGISGSGGLIKQGAGLLVLGGTSSYTGTTDVQNGTLVISSMADYDTDSSIGKGASGTALILGNGNNTGTLVYTGGVASTNRFIRVGTNNSTSGGSTILNNGTGALTFTATSFNEAYSNPNTTSRTITLGGSNDGIIQGIIQDISTTSKIGVIKTGFGTWTFQGNNTFTGALSASGGGNLILDYTTNNGSKLADGAALTLGGNTITLKGGAAYTETVLSTTLSAGASRITRDGGSAVLQMNAIARQAGGNLSFTDGTVATTDTANVNGILGGWATVGNHWAINSGSADGPITALTSYTGTLPSTGTGNSAANYTLSGGQTQTGTSTLNAFTLKLAGTGTADNTLALAGTTLNITTTSATSLGGILYVGGGTGTYNITADVGKGINTSATQDLIINTVTGTLNVSAEINTSDSTRTLLKAGAGTLVLGGPNAYTGITRVNEGTLRLTHNTAPGTIAGGIVVQNNATLELTNSVAIGAEALTLTGQGASQNGALRNLASNTSSYAGAISIGAGGARIHSDAGGLLSLTGGIITSPLDNVTFGGAGDTTVSTTSISGAGGLVKQGPGTLTLSGPQTYTGPTYFAQGTVIINGSLASSSIRFASGATIILDAGAPLNAANAVVDLTNATIQINGGTGSPSQPLISAAAITGTPTLANPIPGYGLQIVGSQLLLVEIPNYAPEWSAAPVTKADANEDAVYSASIANDASDANNDPLTFTKVSGPDWLAVAPDGTLSGTPTNSDVGANSFTVSVSDGEAPAVQTTLNITVINTNDTPVWNANPIPGTEASEDDVYTATLVGSVTDVDSGSALTFAKVSGPDWLTVAADGALSGIPNNSDVGVNSFTVSVSDGIATAVPATLEISVVNTNDAPVFTTNSIAGTEATTSVPYTGQTLAGLATDEDSGDILNYAKVTGPAWLSVAPDGTLSGTPSSSDTGVNEFVISVSDTISAPVTATLTIQVNQIIYAITYNGNGQTGGMAPASQEKLPNEAITLATNSGNLVKTGHTFAGWNTAADGTGTSYPAGAIYTINAPLTLYAYWELGTNGTWLPTTAGPFNWNDSANWSGGTIANGFNRTALFTPNITANQTVNVDTATTIGNITFTDSTTSSNNLTISGANALTLSRTAGAPVIDVTQSGRILTISSNIAGTNGLEKTGGGALILSGTNNTYSGTTTISAGTLEGQKNTTDGASPFGTSTIQLNAGTLNSVTIAADGVQTFTFGNDVNVGGNATIKFSRIGGSGSGKTHAYGNLSIGDSTLSLTANNINHTLSFTGANLTGNSIINNNNFAPVNMGAITETGGSHNLTKQGDSVLRLLGTNTYTGTTTISGGTLEVQGSIASSSIINNANLLFNSGSAQSFSNGISGSGALTKQGGGTLTLGGSNSYTGATSVQQGTLSINSIAAYGTDSSIGKGTSGTAIILGNATTTGTLEYTGAAVSTDRRIQVGNGSTNATGGATIMNNGTGTLVFTATAFNPTYANTNNITRTLTLGGTNGGTIEGAIVNSSSNARVGVAKTGAGTWTLGGTNSFTGNTDVNGGTLEIRGGDSSRTQTVGALGFAGPDGTLTSTKAGAGSVTTTFSGFTARSMGNTGNVVVAGGTNGTDNNINLGGGSQGFIDRGIFFGGNEYAARSATGGFIRALHYGVDVSTSTTATAGNHVKLTSSYSGAGMTLLSLNLQGEGINWTNTSSNLTVPGILKSGGGSQSTISGGNVATSSNAELVIRTDTTADLLLISSNLTHGSGALTKSGAGTLILSGTNTFSGQTHINAGTLSIGANVHLGAEAAGATLNLKGGTLQATGTFGLFNGTAGTNNRAVTLLDQSSIEVTGTNTLTIAGVISDNASAGGIAPGFSKTGTGTLVLSAANTYTGVTNVNEGTLVLTGATQATSAINVASGATLEINTSSPVNAPNAAVNLTNATIKITGSINPSGQSLITAATITGTPTLASSIPGYELQLAGSELRLVKLPNHAPVWTNNPISAPDGSEGLAYSGQTLAGLATDSDPGDSITYSKVSGPAWLAVAADGTLSGTPTNGSAGLNSFVVRATDSNAASADATLEITVIGLPLPWVATDIGTGMLAGATGHDAGTFTVVGSGVIGGTSDGMHFAYQTLTGDGEITARISNLQNTGTSSRVGVMIRDTLAANSMEVFMGMTGANDYILANRTTTAGSTSTTNSSSGTVPDTWVRLVRSGTTITAYKSTDGTSWTSVGSTTNTTFGSTCYIGLAVGSGSVTTLNTSQFSNVTVVP